MSRQKVDQVAISRVAGGDGFEIPAPRFGPMFAAQIRLQGERHRQNLLEFPHLSSEFDEIIISAFEKLRDGLSVDRFLCDPIQSKRLQSECAAHGLKAHESALNLRLLAIRKRSGSVFKETERPAGSRDVVERLGLGVEAAMRHISLRFGASVDDMLAHPTIGEAFVEHARRISRGGSEIEYRLCALQIRKGRHISGIYVEKVADLTARMIEKRWQVIESVKDTYWRDAPREAGIVELRIPDRSLYLLRTRQIATTLEDSFSWESVNRLLKSDYFSEIAPEDTMLRYVPRKELPLGTPKAWELFLINEYQPRFNWPVTQNAA